MIGRLPLLDTSQLGRVADFRFIADRVALGEFLLIDGGLTIVVDRSERLHRPKTAPSDVTALGGRYINWSHSA